MTAISECVRVYARGALLAATERRVLLTNIVIGKRGTLTCQSQEWSTYWQSVAELKVPSQEEAFALFRQFRPECLETNNGTSILRTLLTVCSLVLVFDADLRPDDLKRHFGTAGIDGIEAVDMTRPLRLKGNFCYALLKANEAGATGLVGERLW